MPFRFEDYTDDQEVVRTIGDLKTIKNSSFWSGYFCGFATLTFLIGLIFMVGLKYDI